MDAEGVLLCSGSERICRGRPDPCLLQERVLTKLLESEERYLPNGRSLFSIQKEVQPHMRSTLAGWMLEVCEEEKCEKEVFPLAMNYLDRFLSVVPVEKSRFQLLGSACLLLASKLRQTLPLSVETVCAYTARSSRPEELRTMELLLLNKLKWDIAAPTAQEFVEHLIGAMGLPRAKEQVVRKHTETFIALCTIDYEFASYPPSMIAAASLAASVTGLHLGPLGHSLANREFTDRLAHSIGCDPECLRTCQEQVEDAVQVRLQQAQRDAAPQHVKSEELERSRTPTDIQDVSL
ncbi:G1/S-specific cyclin-D1-like [Heptranchias perlo]|uniref:G1/S-specific cyclin-D1-like n=1 Tax=Heptranchias perlo TaxID=212740 RepID=UPI003559C264